MDAYASVLFDSAFEEAIGIRGMKQDAQLVSAAAEAAKLELLAQVPIYGWDDTDTMTMVAYRVYLHKVFRQMMYVSGETGEPSVETTSIIEEIVRQQVVEIVGCRSCALSTTPN